MLTAFLLGAFVLKESAEEQVVSIAQPEEIFDLPDLPEVSSLVLDINVADSADWVQLPGIGPVLARRIVRFRERIGGFESVEELKKVYNLSEEVLVALRDQLYVDSLRVRTNRPEQGRASGARPQLRTVDVNTATAAELSELPGIGTVLAQRIINYRESKGGYDNLDEVSRVYHLSKETYEEIREHLTLSPYRDTTLAMSAPPPGAAIQLSRGLTTENNQRNIPVPPAVAPASVDINLADSAALDAVPGIGPVLSRRIIKYRKLLRYFTKVQQLTYVYGLSQETYAMIRPYLIIGNIDDYPKNDLNEAFAKSLAFYPFLSQELAESIVRYRRNLGRFDSWEEVWEVPGMSREVWQELQAYYRL